MMFLLRAAFWGGLVLAVLPTGATKPPPGATELGAIEAASAASAAVADLSQFCARQPGACDTGSQIAVVLGQRMQAGAKMIYEVLTERGTSPERNGPARVQSVAERRAPDRRDTTGSIGVKEPAAAVPATLIPRRRPVPSQDTLTASDRRSAWRGPTLRQEARLQPSG